MPHLARSLRVSRTLFDGLFSLTFGSFAWAFRGLAWFCMVLSCFLKVETAVSCAPAPREQHFKHRPPPLHHS